MKLPNFKILTGVSVLDIPYESDYQFTKECAKLVAEQDKILKERGYGFNKFYYLHFYDSYYTSDVVISMEIDDAIQFLAIKDGYDLVEFESGNLGYVAYYNLNKNGFEIMYKREESE